MSAGAAEEIHDSIEDQDWLRPSLTLITILTCAATAQLFWTASKISWASVSTKWVTALGLAVGASTGLLLLTVILWRRPGLLSLLPTRRLRAELQQRRPILWVFGLVLAVLYPLLVLGPLGAVFSGSFVRLATFWALVLLFSCCLSGLRAEPWQGWHVVASTIALAAAYQAGLLLTAISSFPLSLGWSEASRYYYASLFFGERIYGSRIAFPILHPSRYLLQSIPFVMPGLPLAMHRTWQVLLWFAIPGLTVLLLVRRLRLLASPVGWLVMGWGALFLFQGPVYYHLLLGVLPVLCGFDARRFTRTLLLVLLGSLWCGISRVNWYPMPGMLAAAMYFLDEDMTPAPRVNWRVFVAPAIWVGAGMAAAAAASVAYVEFSGNDPSRFTTSFTSDLLWRRLLPNATYRPGVLIGVSLLVLPMALLVLHQIRSRAWRPSRATGLALWGILFILLAGGLVVSVKIGGGGDLHNMDAFILMLLVIASHVLLRSGNSAPTQSRLILGLPSRLVWLAAAIPAAFVVTSGSAPASHDFQTATLALGEVRTAVQQAVENGEEVLFLSQRHAIPFGLVGAVPVREDYEKVLLMEMAMGDNRAYLDQFYHDLEQQRFALIVSEPLSLELQGRSHAFGEENDVWVKRISAPLLATYEPSVKLRDADIWLLEPK